MKTVKVRIACVVNEHGHWNAVGYYKWTDALANDAIAIAREGLDELGEEKIYWIEAELAVPTIETIQAEGKVIEGE